MATPSAVSDYSSPPQIHQGQPISYQAPAPVSDPDFNIYSEAMAPRDKFLFCFNVSSFAEGCCCGLCTLKTGVTVISILTILGGIQHFFYIIGADYSQSNLLYIVIDLWYIIGLYFGFQGFRGASRSLPLKGRLLYYWIIISLLVLSVVWAFASFWACSNKDDDDKERESKLEELQKEDEDREEINNPYCVSIAGYIFSELISFLVNIYFAYIIYSFYNLLLLGQIVLVNNGKDVVDLMRNIRMNQSSNMEMGPMEGVVVGAPIPEGSIETLDTSGSPHYQSK